MSVGAAAAASCNDGARTENRTASTDRAPENGTSEHAGERTKDSAGEHTAGDEDPGDRVGEMPPKAPGAGPGEARIDRGAQGRFDGYSVGVFAISKRDGDSEVKTTLSILSEDGEELGRRRYAAGDSAELGDARLDIVDIVKHDSDAYILVRYVPAAAE